MSKKKEIPWDRRFGPDDGEFCVLMNAIISCSIDWSSNVDRVFPDDEAVYEYLDETPKTSLVVEIVEKLNEFGFEIKKKE